RCRRYARRRSCEPRAWTWCAAAALRSARRRHRRRPAGPTAARPVQALAEAVADSVLEQPERERERALWTALVWERLERGPRRVAMRSRPPRSRARRRASVPAPSALPAP